MKKIVSLLAAVLLTGGIALADQAVFVDLANTLADQCSVAHDAAVVPEDLEDAPSWFRNWRLRSNLKDIRDIALSFRDRAARDKARGLIGRLKVKRMVSNMQTVNFLVAHGAARNLEAFPPTWEAARGTLGDIVAEMCCGDGAEGSDDKSVD